MNIGKSIGLEYGSATRDAFGDALMQLGAENTNIIVLDGDVHNSTRTKYFAEAYPLRFFNVGIAESNMIGIASGLAASGKDVLAASFAVFLLCNAYDQIRMGIAYPQMNVKLVGSHSGISIGEDGPSQMAIEDLALATSLPNFTVLAPADEVSTHKATQAMFEHHGPVYMRTGRPDVPKIYDDNFKFEIGKANYLRSGDDVTIIACGLMVAVALEAAEILSNHGIEARVIDMHTIKPIDREAIIDAARETGGIVTVEEHSVQGGLGSAVARVVVEAHPTRMSLVGVDDTYAESGTPEDLLAKYGLMPADVVEAVQKLMQTTSTVNSSV